MSSDTPGTIYVICFAATPLAHACHYTGWTLDLDARLAAHRTGRGSRLLAVATARGIAWGLAGSWPGTPAEERRLKRRGSAKQWCPNCRPAFMVAKRTRLAAAQRPILERAA